MPVSTALAWFLVICSSYRLTRLITTDSVTEPLRRAVVRRWPHRNQPLIRQETGRPIPDTGALTPRWIVVLVNCPWCIAPYASAAVLVAAKYAGLVHSWTVVGFGVPAVAAAVGLMSRWEDR
jgi:hypothetical protein